MRDPKFWQLMLGDDDIRRSSEVVKSSKNLKIVSQNSPYGRLILLSVRGITVKASEVPGLQTT